jgi:hypothetical protein
MTAEPYRPPSLDALARLRTRARHALRSWTDAKSSKRLLEAAEGGTTREHEAATLRCLVAMAEALGFWEYTRVDISVVPLGCVIVRPELMIWHQGEAAAAWSLLCQAGAVRATEAGWLTQVGDDCEPVREITTAALS